MTKENLGSRHRGEENSMIDRFKIETFFNIVRGTRLVVRKKGLKKGTGKEGGEINYSTDS